MNEEQLFEQAFNDEPVTNAQALVEQPPVEVSQPVEVEVAQVEAPIVDEQVTQQPSESQQPKHWIDLVPDEARKELEPILQDWRSNHGRVSALTKKTLEQEAMIAELQSKIQGQAQPQEQEAPEPTETVDDPLAVLKGEFPELGNSIEQVMAYERQRLQKEFEQKLTPLEQMRLEQEQRAQALQRQSALDEVGRAHPDWQQVVQAPVFRQWLGQQPTAVQDILQNSETPSENIWLLSQFKRDMALASQQRQMQAQAKTSRLAQSAGVKPTGKPAVGNDDPDALFAYAYQNA